MEKIIIHKNQDSYEDRKGKYDKKPDNIFSKKRISAYGIFVEDSKILMIKPSRIDIWECPGGGKENNENIYQTLKREFLEET